MTYKPISDAASEINTVFVPDTDVSFCHPLLMITREMKWGVLPRFLIVRASQLITEDELIQSTPAYGLFAAFAVEELKGLKLPDYRIIGLAEDYLGMGVGRRPSRNSWDYHYWLDKYIGAEKRVKEELDAFKEYILRHILKSSDFSLEVRASYLHWIARKLYRKCSESSLNIELKASASEWFEKTKGEAEAGLERIIVEQANMCAFTHYNLDAIESFVGPERQALCQLIEANAKEKLRKRFEYARKELALFADSVNRSLETGAMRENELSFECKIFKARLSCHITDIGGGLVFARKAKKGVGRVVAATAWTAALGAVACVFPPAALAIPGVVKDCFTSD